MTAGSESQLAGCELKDLHRLRRTLKQAKRKKGKAASDALAAFTRQYDRSREIRLKRLSRIPDNIRCSQDLPVFLESAKIKDALQTAQVVIVAGETGSGKTTQLPKICLEAGFGHRGKIGHTQPRRLAAISVAERIAEEIGVEPGTAVGYQVRFNDKSDDLTTVKVMTDGILLSEIQQDRFLNQYEVLIIDEAHERSLNIDFLLGYLHQLLPKRPELKLVITSATIDVERFSRHFDDAPIIQVGGRTYPVDIHYHPLNESREPVSSEPPLALAIRDTLIEIQALPAPESNRDVLVFLATEREIRETAAILRKARLGNLEILPLYSRLKHGDQQRIFKPAKVRRVVLSTNIAETSLTVPGIRYVIDAGTSRVSRYSVQSKIQRLPIEPISQASANQRAGRCGRVAPGVCYRLYSRNDFEARPEHTDPEILRTNLASVILQMQTLGLGEIDKFPFLEKPENKSINDGFKLLQELGGLDSRKRLTEAGRRMARLPLDPKLARMVVAGDQHGCLQEILIVTSFLAIQDPREDARVSRERIEETLPAIIDKGSDFVTILNLWREYEERRQSHSANQLGKFCKNLGLSFIRMREWRETHHQVRLAAQHLGLRLNKRFTGPASLHKAMLSGALNEIGSRADKREYTGTRGKRFRVSSSSFISETAGKWLVCGELIETAHAFAGLAANIQPEWIVEIADHLLQRTYSDPFWSTKQQQVMGYEKISLYGLVVVEKQLVPYSHIDAAACREIFINDGLMQNSLRTRHPFLADNIEYLESVTRQEDKLRRPDLIVSERKLRMFYEQQLPESVVDTASLEKWLRGAGKERKAAQKNSPLHLESANLFDEAESDRDSAHFPDQVSIQNNALQVDYVFDPGNQSDGSSIQVPVELLPQISRADIDWAVPGLVRDRCIALIKSLPKATRKNFIPVSGFVDSVLPGLQQGGKGLLNALIESAWTDRQVRLDPGLFNEQALPPHLLPNIQVIDAQGKVLATAKDIEVLKHELINSTRGKSGPGITSETGTAYLAEPASDWDFEPLPDQVEVGDHLVLIRFPALQDLGDKVAPCLLHQREAAHRTHKAGCLKLFTLRTRQQFKLLERQFSHFSRENSLVLREFIEDLPRLATLCCYQKAFQLEQQAPRNRESFYQLLEQGRGQLVTLANELEAMLLKFGSGLHKIRKQLNAISQPSLEYVRKDIEAQLANLFQPGFLEVTGFDVLREYPRYLEAIEARLRKLPFPGPKDALNTETISAYWSQYEDIHSIAPSDEAANLRWMIEELRVSLFAQQLGTNKPVSPKRIDKTISALRQSHSH